jgi:hypothetical protein
VGREETVSAARKSFPGRFITLEGGEGAGKTTQIRLLADRLAERGIETLLTREPGGTAGAEAIRSLLVTGDPERWDAMTETLLHYAARRAHVEKTVKPALIPRWPTRGMPVPSGVRRSRPCMVWCWAILRPT